MTVHPAIEIAARATYEKAQELYARKAPNWDDASERTRAIMCEEARAAILAFLAAVELSPEMVEAWSTAKPDTLEHQTDDEANRAWATADWKAMRAQLVKEIENATNPKR